MDPETLWHEDQSGSLKNTENLIFCSTSEQTQKAIQKIAQNHPYFLANCFLNKKDPKHPQSGKTERKQFSHIMSEKFLLMFGY